LKNDFQATVKTISIKSLDITNREQLYRALADFMADLARCLRQGEPNTTCFAPIGGYKVLTSYGYIVGSFLGYPTAYLHEETQILQIIPPVPIDINLNFVEKNSLLIRKCMNEGVLQGSQLTRQEREIVMMYPSIFESETRDDEDYITLTPFGLFLFERAEFAAKFQTRFWMSETVKNLLDRDPSKKAFAFQQIYELVQKIKGDFFRNRGVLFHESTFESLKGKTLSYHLYKGASNERVFRAAWRYLESEDCLYINYLWLDSHNDYEREAEKGIGLLKDEGQFFEVTNEVFRVVTEQAVNR
jgi:hypothetical protein